MSRIGLAACAAAFHFLLIFEVLGFVPRFLERRGLDRRESDVSLTSTLSAL